MTRLLEMMDDLVHAIEIEKAVNELASVKEIVEQPVQFIYIPLPPPTRGNCIVGWLFVRDYSVLTEAKVQKVLLDVLKCVSRIPTRDYSILDVNLATFVFGGPAIRHFQATVQTTNYDSAIEYFSRELGPGDPEKYSYHKYE